MENQGWAYSTPEVKITQDSMNHRILRVRELIKREVATIIERNFSFNGSFVTIHDVELTQDLKQCVIYAGVIGKAVHPENLIRKLNDSRSMISRELFKRVILKNSPSLLFKFDDSIERGVRLLQAIENLPEPIPVEEEEEDEEKQS